MAGRSTHSSDKGKKRILKSPSSSGDNKYTSGANKYSKSKPESKEKSAAPRTDKKTEPKEAKRASGTRGSKRFDEKPRESRGDKKTFGPKKFGTGDRKDGPAKKFGSATSKFSKPDGKFSKSTGGKFSKTSTGKFAKSDGKFSDKKSPRRPFSAAKANYEGQGEKDGMTRLNKFLSNAGIASRREADGLIELGLVKVNGIVVTELGHKVDPRKDVILFEDRSLKPERLQYVLLNKPKDFITTMDDDKDRRTVMSLVENACKERIYPVGRLDRNTTGLLLFTNDGELAKRLTHPRYGISKLYHIELTTKVNGRHLDEIREGIKLEDGEIKADEISFVNDDPFNVGIRIHSGKNRVVRRIFESLGYTVKKLDRVMFAGLTKKDLTRGRCRHLTEQEVGFLKMIK